MIFGGYDYFAEPDVTISGGTQPYTFSWTGPNGYTESTEDIM